MCDFVYAELGESSDAHF